MSAQSASVIERTEIIDADTHVTEPPDLWTSRVPSRWREFVPQVRWNESAHAECWFVGDQASGPIGSGAMAGWNEWPPDCPRRWSDIAPMMWDASARATLMDQYGIGAQILYPNVVMFSAKTLMEMDPRMTLEVVRAYNDYQVEWGSSEPGRFIPIAMVPFWDIDASVKELVRCSDSGHHGMIFTQDPTYFGLPKLTDHHWDPLWQQAQELGFPVNFHIASAGLDVVKTFNPADGRHANKALSGTCFFMGTAKTIGELITGGICHRFPRLNFVSVESGVGWIPFYLSGLDWQWKNCGVIVEHPEYDLLPSEYFARQIYGCFWFEGDTATDAINRLGPNNVLFETDFPHPTSMTPGPLTSAIAPKEHIARMFADLPETWLAAIMHDNAARIYNLA